MVLTGLYSQVPPVEQPLEEGISRADSFASLFSKTNITPPARISVDTFIDWISSSNIGVRLHAAVELDNERSKLIEELMGIVNGTSSVDAKVTSVIVLGQYKAAESVPVLVKHLEWDEEHEAVIGGNPSIGNKEQEALLAPVSDALINIGLPAIPALLARIAGEDDTKVIYKCVGICRGIEGGEVTQFRLERLLEVTTDLNQKKRIQSALEALEIVKAWEMRKTGIPMLLEKVSETEDTNMTMICIKMCLSIEGQASTEIRLNALLDNAIDSKQKDRIQFALDGIKALKLAK